MKTNRYLLGLALLVVGTMPVFSQVSNDNEDEVYKIDARVGRNDFVPGQVLVKFKDDSSAGVRRSANGVFKSSGISVVDNLLKDYGVKDVEKLFPIEEAKSKARLRRATAYNGTIVEEKNLDKVFWVKTNIESLDSTLQLIKKLEMIPEVEYAEPNFHVYITADMPNSYSPQDSWNSHNAIRRTPAPSVETNASVICATPENNALYSQQYGIKLHNIDKLWNVPIINKKRPVIAILDTGVDINHPDLKDNIWTNKKEFEGERAYDDDGNGIVDDEYGWNFVDDYYDVIDRNRHGTHVAGIAAACDNNIGIVGANAQALIMPVKVISDNGSGNIASVCRGIIYAAEMGADIINMSFGHAGTISLTEVDAIQKAYQTSILVASAGNNGASVYDPLRGPLYPAAYYLVLGVQSCGKDGKISGFSNYDPDGPIYSEDGENGRNHEMMMAGEDILSTLPEGNYNKLNGTSMSAPLLSGAISALKMVKEYPSNDVLFGDLIHLNADFEKIYSDDTPRTPKIDILTFNIDDKNGGNGDSQIDAGETVDLYAVLRNTWADATDIKVKLTVDEKYIDVVSIDNPEVDFGWSLSAYGKNISKTPFKVQFSNNIAHNTRVKFLLEIDYVGNTQDNMKEITKDIYFTVNNMVKIGGYISADMTLTSDKNYLVSNNIVIPEGIKFIIEPGTTLLFSQNTGIVNQGEMKIKGTPEKHILLTTDVGATDWDFIGGKIITNEYGQYIGMVDTLEYCRIENTSGKNGGIYCKNCVFDHITQGGSNIPINSMYRCNITEGYIHLSGSININQRSLNEGESNFVNNRPTFPPVFENYGNVNYFNNRDDYDSYGGQWQWHPFYFVEESSTTGLVKPILPSYYGTSKEEIANTLICDIDYNHSYAQADLSTMLKEPIKGAHGIVWKVVVNGKDAQDEYEELDPLGVGKHKFEVYFNRPMNKAKIPQISFGVREPYTQNTVAEDGSWNAEGTIYTAYVTITGKTQTDGVNRIYVYGAEDNEFFECPYEKSRFNVNVQSAGSQSIGFSGEAGLGRVELNWNELKTDVADVLGFNVYRYTSDPADSIRVNDVVIDATETHFTDYDIVPSTTYYYKYKVQSTDLQEFQPSNVVAVTPKTAKLGDVTGNNEVDVFDVVYEVNYILGQKPKAFVKCAADVNEDNYIDILDVQGIIIKILNPSSASARIMVESTATYSIEDGILYVESPVALGGLQVQVNVPEKTDITTLDDLKGFEQAGAWLSDNDYLFLAYNMNGKTLSAGKHALLRIGNGQVTNIRLGDADGKNVEAIAGAGTTSIDNMSTNVWLQQGIYNLKGQKISGNANELNKLPKGVYIINGTKILK